MLAAKDFGFGLRVCVGVCLFVLCSCQRPHRLVVRTSRCGRDNPGSTPGVVMEQQRVLQDPTVGICLCVCLLVCLLVCLFVCLSVWLAGCLSVGLSVGLSFCVFVDLLVCS